MNKTLTAPKGMVYTNGTTYGYVIRLAEGLKGEDYYLITEEEYRNILEKEAELSEREKT